MRAKLVLVGESYGRHEQKHNHPLVWYSGVELARMLHKAELAPKPSFCYPAGTTSLSLMNDFELKMIEYWKMLRSNFGIAVTNIFNEHPMGDQTDLFFSSVGEIDLPAIRIKNRVLRLRPEYRHHIDRFAAEIEELQPNLIVCLGNFACWGVLGKTTISSIRGTVSISERFKIKTLPTFHPAALRDEKLRPTIVADLTKAKRESEFPEIRRIERWVVAEDPRTKERVTRSEIEAWIAQPAETYATDIETAYILFTKAELQSMPWAMKKIISELISMVAFARDSHNAVVIPFMTRDDPEMNYWSFNDEVTLWKIVIEVLKNPKIRKVFQNGMFDVSHFLRNLIRVFSAAEDPMILHHALYAELPKSLGYLSSIHSDEIAHKLMRSGGESLKREE